ncbi:unnamed protein product, partial [Ectocarpus sp. 12 AP-2014]
VQAPAGDGGEGYHVLQHAAQNLPPTCASYEKHATFLFPESCCTAAPDPPFRAGVEANNEGLLIGGEKHA